jgi:hypothetical protein
MKNIDRKSMLEELQNLKIGETIFIPIDEDVSNTIQLLYLKCQSYQNLFMSYMNNTCESASKMNIDSFLEKYSEAFSQIEAYKNEMLKKYLGDAFEYFMRNKFRYNFNYPLNVLEITKVPGKEVTK